MNQESAFIISNREVMPGVHLTWIESPGIAAEARPGQFVMLSCGEETLLRPLSIHQQDGDNIALLYTVVGKGTQWLSQRQAGDKLDLLGPLGNGYSVDHEAHNLLLVAGGIGIAPLCFLARETLRQGRSVKLLLGASTATQLYPSHLLPSGLELITATEDGTAGQKGMITDLLPQHVDRADRVCACGPVSMYGDMYARREEQLLKGKPTQVSLEMRMGCGLGICYGCTVKTKSGLKQVCKDGPVFDLHDILWEEPGYLGIGGNRL